MSIKRNFFFAQAAQLLLYSDSEFQRQQMQNEITPDEAGTTQNPLKW